MPLPDFLIIGAMKGGTQAAVRNLSLHPDVWLVDAATKRAMQDPLHFPEVHFFDDDERWNRGLDWYERFFETDRSFRLRGEKTPEYLSCLDAHERMHQVVPSARLIVLLRDPVARAFSHWQQMVELRPEWDLLGLHDMSFDDAVRCVLSVASQRKRPPDLLWKGCYADQIEHLLRWYSPEQVLICISERVRRHMEEEYARMFAFLGARPLFTVAYAESHVRDRSGVGEAGADSTAALAEFYAEHNSRLFCRLGETPREWQSVAGAGP